MVSRRQFVAASPGMLGGAFGMSGCVGAADSPETYATVAERTWRSGPILDLAGDILRRELVRNATLAPSSHNTQCWKFAIAAEAITVLPDLSRRCPAVDPDDHHVYVSLGCATENLIQAAAAHGLRAEASFDPVAGAIRVSLSPAPPVLSPLFQAIPARQCTRSDFDGHPLSNAELGQLAAAGSSARVKIVLLTDRPVMERVLEHVTEANTAQIGDPAFVRELKSWIRFNAAAAVLARDGLYSATTGSPSIPSWLGEAAFRWLFTARGENDRIVSQIRSSAGLAIFVGLRPDKAHWVEVGRCYERFALQATALGIRNAFLNQPVEVIAARPRFAEALGLQGQRPDLVARFGRGPTLPRSLRREVQAVLA